MSLQSWLTGNSPKPGLKRKYDLDNIENYSPKKKFCKEINQSSFEWYVLDSDGKWHCSLCRSVKADNAYARGHDKPAKTTNHVRHAASQCHLSAVTRCKLAPQQPLKQLVFKKLDKDDEIMMGYLRCAYHLAKREQAKEEFPHLISLMDDLGVATLKDKSCTYTSVKSVTEFQSACAKVVLENIISDITDAGVYSIMLDESTDKGNRKRLLLYAQYFHDGALKNSLLENVEITTAKADSETITMKVLTELNCKGLDISKLVGVGTDGASVMTGRKTGVVVRLKEHNPFIVGVHCAAHRCALAASQAAKFITQVKDYSHTVSNIFDYFNASALRSNKLREIQLLLNIPTLKYAQVHSVRWLSLEKSVEVLYRTYPALLVALEHEAISNPAAKGIFHEVSQYRFIAITHMLMDILPFLGKLSKTFQSETVDFSKIKPVVNSTCEALQDLKECEGMYVDKLSTYIHNEDDKVLYRRPVSESSKSVIKEGVDFNLDGFDGFKPSDDEPANDQEETECVELKFYTQQKCVIQTVMPDYIDKIVSNLHDRFQESELVEKMQVLQPFHILHHHGNGELAKYGMAEILCLAKHFSSQSIDCEETCVEYRQYKRLVVGSFTTCSMSEICAKLDEQYSDVMPNIVKLVKCCLTVPVSSASCERGFSTQNRIKSRLRTNMNNSTLNDLMRISEDGPPKCDFNFRRALQLWKCAKDRKIYNC